MKTKERISLLEDRLVSVGLLPKQATEYVWFISRLYQAGKKHGAIKKADFMPSEECLQTLAEAQRIVAASAMNKVNPRELSVFEIQRFLRVPDIQWKEAKVFIADFFQRKNTAVNAMYNLDEGWLLITPEECSNVARYLNSICFFDSDLAWKLFQHAGLLGREETEKRISKLFDLLGPEDSFELIRWDLWHNNWLFYRHDHTDPVGCIAYLKQCGLSNAQIMELISQAGYILYLFNKKSAQARIDSIINRFQYDWAGRHGPCYDGLTPEEIDFLMHGPRKMEW